MSDAHLTVIEDRLRTSQDYRAWRAAEVGATPMPITASLHKAISDYGDARAAMALTTATKGLKSAAHAQGLVAIHYRAVLEEITLLSRMLTRDTA